MILSKNRIRKIQLRISEAYSENNDSDIKTMEEDISKIFDNREKLNALFRKYSCEMFQSRYHDIKSHRSKKNRNKAKAPGKRRH